MIIKLRKQSQITIPKEIVDELKLQAGDDLQILLSDRAILIEPVAVYSKTYTQKLEEAVRRVKESLTNGEVGPFKSVEEAMAYLEE